MPALIFLMLGLFFHPLRIRSNNIFVSNDINRNICYDADSDYCIFTQSLLKGIEIALKSEGISLLIPLVGLYTISDREISNYFRDSDKKIITFSKESKGNGDMVIILQSDFIQDGFPKSKILLIRTLLPFDLNIVHLYISNIEIFFLDAPSFISAATIYLIKLPFRPEGDS